eukprot:Pgem_evm1s14831
MKILGGKKKNGPARSPPTQEPSPPSSKKLVTKLSLETGTSKSSSATHTPTSESPFLVPKQITLSTIQANDSSSSTSGHSAPQNTWGVKVKPT